MEGFIKFIISSVATFFIWFIGGIDIALISLILVMCIDYLTGILKAIKKKKLSSKIGFEGIGKKLGIIFLIGLSVIVDRLMGDSGVIRTMVIYFYVANDGISILENLAEIGVPIPEFLKEKLHQLTEDEEGDW